MLSNHVEGEGARKARECDAAVPGDDMPFAGKLTSYGEEGRVLGPTVGCWCETSSDFDLLVELIAHVLADKETSVMLTERGTWPGESGGQARTSLGHVTESNTRLALSSAPTPLALPSSKSGDMLGAPGSLQRRRTLD